MASSPAADLVAWIRSQGGYVHPQLDLCHELPGGDRGVVALADLEEGAQLCLIPVACTLHIPSKADLESRADKGVYPPAAVHLAQASQGDQKVSSFISTVLLLMSEAARGDKSPWQAYIRTLPDSCDCLLSWSDEDKQHLKGTSIEDLTGGAATEAAFNNEVAPQVRAHPELWPKAYQGFDAFCRYAGLVQSRAFHMLAENWITGTSVEGDEVFLIPGIDMINHSSDPKRRNAALLKMTNTISTEVDGKTVTVEGFFTMTANEPIAKGQQVLHTYGDLSDSQLLQTYGFIDIDSETPTHTQNTQHTHKQPAYEKAEKQEEEMVTEARERTRPHEDAEATEPAPPPSKKSKKGQQASSSSKKDAQKAARAKADAAVSALESTKVDFLVRVGLLQSVAPRETQFVITNAAPLPDELLTTVQVLLMEEMEFRTLVTEYDQEQQENNTGDKADKDTEGSAKTDPGATQTNGDTSTKGAPTLSLGKDLLQEDVEFAEVVSLTLMRAQLECDVELITRMETCDHLHTCHRFHACDQSHVAFQLFQKLMLDASS